MAYDLYSFLNSAGTATLTAITAPNGCAFGSAQDSDPWPRLRILGGWMSIWGTSPNSRAADRVVSAAGSDLVIHELRSSHGVLTAYRVIARKASTGATVQKIDGTALVNIPEGYFCDLMLGMSGNVNSVTSPAMFDKDNTPGSAGIYDTIDAEKHNAGVG